MGAEDRVSLGSVFFSVFFAAACAAEGIVAVALGWSADLICEPIIVGILLIGVSFLTAERHGDIARADRATIGAALALAVAIAVTAVGLGVAALARDGTQQWRGYLLIFGALCALTAAWGLGYRILAAPSEQSAKE